MDLHFCPEPMKRAVFAGVLAVLLSLAASFPFISATKAVADETQETPEEMVIDNQVYETDRKGSVWFSHLNHADGYADSCEACHHDYQDGKNLWEEGLPVAKCSSCHDPEESEGSLKKLYIAFHKSCKGCHKRFAAEGGTSAPYKQCTDCHEKK